MGFEEFKLSQAGAPPLVYLDSSDYSTLSDKSKSDQSTALLRETFRELANTNQARFVFSGVHVSEMAPLGYSHTAAAVDRIDLLTDLCGRRTFVSFDRLLQLELGALLCAMPSKYTVLSEDGEWFPDLGELLAPFRWESMAREIDIAVKDKGINREQRRKLRRTLFKDRRPVDGFRSWMASLGVDGGLEEILRLYPMRPQDAAVLSRYVLGQVSASVAEQAFLESLRDPRWMMRWFLTQHDKMNAVADWLRKPAQDMVALMTDSYHNMQKLRLGLSGDEILENHFQASQWKKLADESLVRIAQNLGKAMFPTAEMRFSCAEVEIHCPGLSTAVRTLQSMVRDSFAVNPRQPKSGDFVDAVHAMYAPYVDVFRADRSTAPHVERHVKRYGTKVINKVGLVRNELQKKSP